VFSPRKDRDDINKEDNDGVLLSSANDRVLPSPVDHHPDKTQEDH
jgi:hypothetical protein